MSRRLAALLAAALIASTVVACGGDDDDGGSSGAVQSGAAPSGTIPSGAVATIGDAEISEEALGEQVAALVRAKRGALRDGGSSSSDGSVDDLDPDFREQLEDQALAMLLAREAVEQEAAKRGLEVADAEVQERWKAAGGGRFKTKKELRRFLGGQTEDDLLVQIRLQLLTERIHEQVSEQAGGGKQGAEAVEQYQQIVRKRWIDRIACRDGYAVPGCGTNGDSE